MLSNIWHKSWTDFWGWLKIVGGGAVAGAPAAVSVITNPDVRASISQILPDPRVGLVIAILGAITLISMEHK